MRIRPSHKLKIAAVATVASAVLFASVLTIAYLTMLSMERRASLELLEAPMHEVIGSLKSGEPLDEEVGAEDRVTVAVFSADGKLLFRSGTAPIGAWTGSGDLRFNGRDFIYRTSSVGSKSIVAAVDWTRPLARVRSMGTVFAMLLLPLALVVGLAAYVAADLMYRPLRKLTFAAKTLAAEGRIGQLQDPGDHDFSPLAQEINVLLQRISSEVERQERLVSDVAHDLRTPLTVIRGRLETALMQGNASDYPSAMRTAIREAERLSAMAESILRSGLRGDEFGAIELSSVLVESVDRWRPAFEKRGATLEISATRCHARITGEEWNSILDNLLDNEFKYGGDHCHVSLTAGENVVLEVRDNGPGVPDDERKRVFDRFVRLDTSRSSEGHGLGLYLCASFVRKRGGSIEILSEPGMALRLTLPAANP